MASLTYGKCNLCQIKHIMACGKNVKHMMANETEAIQMQISSGINQL